MARAKYWDEATQTWKYADNSVETRTAQWGNLIGDITDQTDLMEALDDKEDVLTFDDAPTSGSNNPVKSSGIYSAVENSASPSINIWDGKLESGSISWSTGENYGSDGSEARSIGYTKVMPGTQYYYHGQYSYDTSIFFYKDDYTFISHYEISRSTVSGVFTTPSNAGYIRFSLSDEVWGEVGDISINYPASYTGYYPPRDSKTLSDMRDVSSILMDFISTGSWNQILRNGNFADTSGWAVGGAASSFSVSANEATVVCGSGESYLTLSSAPLISGHLYYVRADVYSSAANTAKYVSLEGSYSPYNDSGWSRISSVANATYVRIGVKSGTPATTLKIKNVILIDVTDIYNKLRDSYHSYYTVQDNIQTSLDLALTRDYYPHFPSSGITANNEAMMLLDGYISPVINGIGNYRDGNTYHKRIGRVDLGSLEWEGPESVSERFISRNVANCKTVSATTDVPNISCSIFNTVSPYSTYSHDGGNEIISNDVESNRINIYSASRASLSASAFKAAMSGVYLYYELATEVTRNIDGAETGESLKRLGDVIAIRGWNQLMPTTSEQTSVKGVSLVSNGDGSFTLHGTSTMAFQLILINNLNSIKNHKVFAKLNTSGILERAGIFVQAWGTGAERREWGSDNGIIVQCTSPPTYRLSLDFASGVTFNNVVIRPQLHDLTAMGLDSINTPEEFCAIFDKDYYPPARPLGNLAELSYTVVSTW